MANIVWSTKDEGLCRNVEAMGHMSEVPSLVNREALI